jgi:UDP-GlcNAc:undecaprenyl-phosphate GlcNAc-1-phosphate transferase
LKLSDFYPFPSMLVAFAITVAFMLALRPLAHSLQLVDRPGGRKSHVGEVPIIGGIAMFIGVFAGLALLQGMTSLVITLLLASSLLVLIGVLDDKYALSASVRLAVQIASVLIMFFGSGLRLVDIGDPLGIGVISLGPVSLVLTTLVAVTVINAYNLIDGADGLAGSLSVIALLSISLVGGYSDPSTAVSMTVIAAVFGFLIFNFPTTLNRPVRSFMGDAGSTFLGFTIVWVALGASQGTDRLVSPIMCLWFAAVPIFDLMTCVFQRMRAGKSPFTPGRDHFHHVLNRGSEKVRRTLGVLTALQGIYAGIGLFGHYFSLPDWIMFVGWCILGFSQYWIIRRIAKVKRWLRIRRTAMRRANA